METGGKERGRVRDRESERGEIKRQGARGSEKERGGGSFSLFGLRGTHVPLESSEVKHFIGEAKQDEKKRREESY